MARISRWHLRSGSRFHLPGAHHQFSISYSGLATIGKAMDPLEEEEGTIVVQVMLG
jgi:hypothetical protein